MEAKATAKFIRISARKARLVAANINGRPVEDALNILKFTPKKSAKILSKVLYSAIANAENNHNLDVDRLIVAEASVGKGLVMKRFQTRGRGRAAGIVKPFSHLTIVVRERPEAEEK